MERRAQSRLGVTHRNVETLLGRLATDPALRHRFARDATGVLNELRDHGYELTLDRVDHLTDELAGMTLDERRTIRGLHPDRAPAIVAGSVILGEAMRAFRQRLRSEGMFPICARCCVLWRNE